MNGLVNHSPHSWSSSGESPGAGSSPYDVTVVPGATR
jgi:hypothetical protein